MRHDAVGKWASRLTFIVALVVAMVSAVLVLGVALSWVHPAAPGEVASGAAGALASSVAVLGALAGVTTWERDRAAVREQRARDGYDALLSRIGDQYAMTSEKRGLMKARSAVAVWGSPVVINAVADWNRQYDTVTSRSVRTDDGYALAPDDAETLSAAYLRLVEVIRSEVGGDGVSVDRLASTMFNATS